MHKRQNNLNEDIHVNRKFQVCAQFKMTKIPCSTECTLEIKWKMVSKNWKFNMALNLFSKEFNIFRIQNEAN